MKALVVVLVAFAIMALGFAAALLLMEALDALKSVQR